MVDFPVSVHFEPAIGDLFSVRYLKNLSDGSYRSDIFKMRATDGNMLIADLAWRNGKRAYPTEYNRLVFMVDEWAFSPITENIIAALESPITEFSAQTSSKTPS
jgi:hypothetical protein